MVQVQRRFLAIGECMVEMSPRPDGSFRMGFAGDTFNTAWYARRLLHDGWSVGYGSCVGTDATSGRMLAFMEGAGIDTATVRRIEDRTVGLYMIQLENGERSFSYWRGQSAARALADDPGWLATIMAGADVIFFSGITLAILAPDARLRFCAALADARAAGKLVVFDTNMRPRLWPGAAAMRDGIMQGAAVADLVLPSFDEEAAFFGDASPEATAARYHSAGARLVVVKNGAGEVLISDAERGESRVTPAPVARVVDTTAAGDSFDAGFLAAYLSGSPAEDAVRRGMAVAARVIQAPGALADIGELGQRGGA